MIVTLLRVAPLQFGKGGHTRQGVVLHVFETVHVLSPNVGLHTDDVFLLLLVELFGQRLEGIDTLHGQIAVGENGFLLWRKRLSLTEIEVVSRSHHHIVPLLGRRNTAGGASPAHNHRTLVDIALQNLVPADDAAAACPHELLHTVHHVALQVILCRETTIVVQAELLDPRLAFGTLFPAGFGTLVASDVDDVGREDIHHLAENILQKTHGRLVAGADHLIGDAPAPPDLVWAAGAAKRRACRQRSLGMTGQIYFRDDGDMTFGGVGHQVAEFLLRVETAMTDRVIAVGIASEHGAAAPSAGVGQLGITLDLHAPPLVIGEMEVELVHIVHRHHIEIAFHRIEGDEVAAHIEVHAAVGELRMVNDASRRKLYRVGLHARRDALAQGLDGVEDTGSVGAAHDDFVGADVNLVRLRGLAHSRVLHQEDAGGGGLVQRLDLQLDFQEVVEIFVEELGFTLQGVLLYQENDGVPGELERGVFGHRHLFRQRDDLIVSLHDARFAACQRNAEAYDGQHNPYFSVQFSHNRHFGE